MLKGTKGEVAVLLGKQEQRSQNNPDQTAQKTISIPFGSASQFLPQEPIISNKSLQCFTAQ